MRTDVANSKYNSTAMNPLPLPTGLPLSTPLALPVLL